MSEFDKFGIHELLEERIAFLERVGYGGRLPSMAESTAEYRCAMDDLAAGRLHWKSARINCDFAQDALALGDDKAALMWLIMADSSMLEALERRLRPDDLKYLSTPAKPRGRKKTA